MRGTGKCPPENCALMASNETRELREHFDREAPHQKTLYYGGQRKFTVPQESGRLIWDTLRPRSGAWVVDVGCGVGLQAAAVAARGARCVACDFSRGILLEARKNAPGVHLVQADASRLPFRTGVVDGAYSWYMIQHIPRGESRRAALREMARILCPGGRLFIATGNGLSLLNGLQREWPRRWWIPTKFGRLYARSLFPEEFRDALGASVQELRLHFRGLATPYLLWRALAYVGAHRWLDRLMDWIPPSPLRQLLARSVLAEGVRNG